RAFSMSIRVPGSAGSILLVALGLDPVRLGLDHRPLARRVDNALLDPRVATVEDRVRALGVQVVVVRPQLCEELVCTTPRLAAEQVRQLARLLGALRALLLDRLRVDARGGDRVELGTDVDDAAEERLLALHLRL